MTGGLLFGVAGAMAGFVVGAISGLFLSLFYNLTAFLFGGLAFRFRERRKTGEPRTAVASKMILRNDFNPHVRSPWPS